MWPPPAWGADVDFRLGEKSDLLRKEAREFLREVVTPEMLEECYRSGVLHDATFARALVDKGWMAPGWPVEYGGQGRDPVEAPALPEVWGLVRKSIRRDPTGSDLAQRYITCIMGVVRGAARQACCRAWNRRSKPHWVTFQSASATIDLEILDSP